MSLTRCPSIVIAAVALPPPRHGQSLVSARVIAALEGARIPVDIVDLSPGNLVRSPNYHLKRVSSSLRAIQALFRHRKCRHRAVYTVVQAGKGVLYSIAIALIARTFGYRLVLHHHSRAYIRQKTCFHNLLANIVSTDAVHVFLSKKMQAEFIGQYSVAAAGCIVSSNACHIESGEINVPCLEGTSLRIGLLSNLSREKGLDLAIKTAHAAQADNADITLILAGPAIGQDSLNCIAQGINQLGERLITLGPVDGLAKRQFFETIDVFIFPSTYRDEAQPLVLLEALSYGIPIIASDHGYIGELVGDAAWLFSADAKFVPRAAEVIKELAMNRGELCRRKEAARHRFDVLHQESFREFREFIQCVFAN